MALQVWLPLTGNLENKGLSNFNITSIESSPTYVNGKIGNCYQRANTSSQITNGLKIDNNLVDLLGSTASVAVWVKPLGTHTHYNGTILSSGNWNSQQWAFGVSQDNSQVDVLCRGHNNYITCAVPVNEWTHLVSTFDNGTCKLYKNGVYIGQLTGQAAFVSDDTWTGIGRESYANGYFGFNGCINDLRIYDHCLTPFEVKEISQGLVLHYLFDDDAYIEQTTNLCEASAGGWDNSGTCTRTANDTAIPDPPTTSNTYSIRATSDGSMVAQIGTTTQNHPSKTIIASTYVWLDGTQDSSPFYLRSTKKDDNVGSLLYKGNANPTTWPQKQWIRIATNAITTTSDATKFYICTYVRKNTEVRAFNGWQIEEKDHITPYTSPGTTRGARTKVFDSSGYAHNGTLINAPTMTMPSPRYRTCMHFNATNQKIQCGILNTAAFGNSYSFAWWAKMASNGPMHWGFSDGNRLNGLYNGNTWNTGDSNSNPLYNPGTTTQVTAPTAGVWHHFVMTGDGTTCKVYQDGVLWATAKTYKPINGTQIFINGWADAISYSSDNYSVSDFRIYATALSADDVKKLYETSMIIDSAGNISARLLN